VRLAFEAAGLQVAGETIGATVSIGAVSGEARSCNLEQLLQRADTALYSAKAHGRNRVATDTGPLDVHAPPLAPRSEPEAEFMAIA
jgi:diguanylate cyclase (GGDEF)-like protein